MCVAFWKILGRWIGGEGCVRGFWDCVWILGCSGLLRGILMYGIDSEGEESEEYRKRVCGSMTGNV